MNVSDLSTIKTTMSERKQQLYQQAEDLQFHHGMSDARAMNCFHRINDINDVLTKIGGDH